MCKLPVPRKAKPDRSYRAISAVVSRFDLFNYELRQRFKTTLCVRLVQMCEIVSVCTQIIGIFR